MIAAAGSDVKLEVCREHGGADHVVNYTMRDWQKRVLEMTNGKGVDVVFDPVGRIAGQYRLFPACRRPSRTSCFTRLAQMHSVQGKSCGGRFRVRQHRESEWSVGVS